LKTLQQSLGITFVFVTHDQGEALSMSDRIAIINEGQVVQVGSPQAIYQTPRTKFVARFVGSSNVLSPQLNAKCQGLRGWSSLRPESVRLGEPGEGRIDGVLISTRYLGASHSITVALGDEQITALVGADKRLPAIGAMVSVDWAADAQHAMEED